MSNELTARNGRVVALADESPKLAMSQALDWVYDRTDKVHADAGAPVPSPVVKGEAKRLLEQLRPYGAPVTMEVIRLWVHPLTASVRNVRSIEDMADWWDAVFLTLRTLEVGAFTVATQRAALRSIKFLPSAADLYDFLGDPAFEIRRKLNVLSRIASTE